MKNFLLAFRGKRRGRETSMWEGDVDWLPPTCGRWRPQPGHVPWWGINEPTTFRCVWTTPNQLRHTGQGQINFEPINSHIQLHSRIRTTLIFPTWTPQPPVCLFHVTWLAFVNSHCEVNTVLCFFTTLLLRERAACLRKAQR